MSNFLFWSLLGEAREVLFVFCYHSARCEKKNPRIDMVHEAYETTSDEIAVYEKEQIYRRSFMKKKEQKRNDNQ